MNDAPLEDWPFREDELTDEDRAVLDAFDAADLEELAARDIAAAHMQQMPLTPEEDIHATFIEEVFGDCVMLDRILQQERNTEGASKFQRIAHKLKGSCGAMNRHTLAGIALHMETLAKRVENGSLDLQGGWQALEYGSQSFALALEDYVASGYEKSARLAEFEAECRLLGIELRPRSERRTLAPPLFERTTHIDRERIDTLQRHVENLALMNLSLAEAQEEVDQAMLELRVAEERLRGLELRLTNLHSRRDPLEQRQPARLADREEQTTSSLIARILREAPRDIRRLATRGSNASALPTAVALDWDELELDRFQEEAMLAVSLSEAISDLSVASSQLRTAAAHLSRLLSEQSSQAISARDGAQLLTLTTLVPLFACIEQEIQAAHTGQPDIQFEAAGAATEIDQHAVEQLSPALLGMIRAGIAEFARAGGATHHPRIWLAARATGCIVQLEIGFSPPVENGTLAELDEVVRALDGTLALRRQASDGMIYSLRVPRERGMLHALIARAGLYCFAIPLDQVRQIMPVNDSQQPSEQDIVALHTLLGLPPEPRHVPASLIEASGEGAEMLPLVQVDEIISDARLIGKRLPPPLQRPGVSGTAIDGANNVLPVLNLLELLRHQPLSSQSPTRRGTPAHSQDNLLLSPQEPHPLTVLVTDDSISMRQALRFLLSREGYEVMEARDGNDALDRLRERIPGALLLDIEMPNANGFDVLNLLPTLPGGTGNMKIIMLTSRLSDKHRKLAFDLGAHAYLTKPCDPAMLMDTLRILLAP